MCVLHVMLTCAAALWCGVGQGTKKQQEEAKKKEREEKKQVRHWLHPTRKWTTPAFHDEPALPAPLPAACLLCRLMSL